MKVTYKKWNLQKLAYTDDKNLNKKRANFYLKL